MKSIRLIFINILLMIVVGVGIVLYVLHRIDGYTNHGASVSVPELKGLSVESAELILKKSNLKYVVEDTIYVKSMPEGCVLESHPTTGEKVKEGRLIYLTINTQSVPMVNIPDVTENSSFRQAAARIQAAGFKLDSVEYMPGERDWVYGVKYLGEQIASDEKVPMGAHLSLLVGNGERLQKTDSIEGDSVINESWFE